MVLDTRTLRDAGRIACGQRLTALAVAPGEELAVVTDDGADEAVLLENHAQSWRVLRRAKVGRNPVGVCISADGMQAAVACLWPRRLFVFDLAAWRKGQFESTVLDLPFAPRHMLTLPGDAKVLVADSFGGELAVADLRRRQVESVRSLPAHNVRGLALDRQRQGVLVSHQVLYSQGHTVAGDIRSANLIANLVRRLSLDVVLNPRADLLKDDRRIMLGDVEAGAGDPAGVAELDDGRLLVALAGVNEVAIGQPDRTLWTRIPVGARPTAVVVDAAQVRAYVANTFADSITVIGLKQAHVVTDIKLGTGPALRPEERGERLFHDARLSLEGWFSCHSCHTDGHTNGRLNDNFTDGSFGTPKRVLSLLGTRDTGPWAWSGKFSDLESQIRNSVKGTMLGKTPSPEQVADLAAYVRTLVPPPSLLVARGLVDGEAVKRGRKVFLREKCALCHVAPSYTSPKTYDVGLRDEVGGSRFNPPSLRGVSQGGPYFHDGRAATLEEVFTRFGHELSGKLGDSELRDLIYFLKSL
jgi:cytochrome c peroxidase